MRFRTRATLFVLALFAVPGCGARTSEDDLLGLSGVVPVSGAGGSGAGGDVGTGGFGRGASDSGGAFITGGFASGGFATGGLSSGGFATGGFSTGGLSTGGFSTGGLASSGGASTGGVSSGGTFSGGTGGIGGWVGGDCCEQRGAPGCEVAPIEECVCAGDPFCCDVEWDFLCAADAVVACMAICTPGGTGGAGSGGSGSGGMASGGTGSGGMASGGTGSGGMASGGTGSGGMASGGTGSGGMASGGTGSGGMASGGTGTGGMGSGGSPGTGDCCDDHGGLGCVDPGIEACVCAADNFCCTSEWDDICVNTANVCGAGCAPSRDVLQVVDVPNVDEGSTFITADFCPQTFDYVTIADVQTANDSEPSFLRMDGGAQCRFTIREGQSLDSETNHADETIAVAAFQRDHLNGLRNAEGGLVVVNSSSNTVFFDNAYTNPVVLAFSSTMNGSEEAIAVVTNVTSTSFEVRMREYEWRDGGHIDEIIHYVVLEAGTHDFGGRTVIAGMSNVSTVFNGALLQTVVNTGITNHRVVAGSVWHDNSYVVDVELETFNDGTFDVGFSPQELFITNGDTVNGEIHWIAFGP